MSEPNKILNGLHESMKGRRRLSCDETFCFECRPELPCFAHCCADVNIMLTPVDVLRLSRRLGLSTGEFLDRHSLTPITRELHLPVAILKMSDNDEESCPFVGENGCSVYDVRPWACRMYPLGMGLPPARAGVEPEPIFIVFEDDFCNGIKEKKKWTAKSWKENQGVFEHEKIEEGFKEIVSHPWFIGGRRLNLKAMEMYFMACYDLDRFRRFVFDSSFLERFDMEDETIKKLRADDEELLKFAFRWLRFALFGEPTMTVRKSALDAGRKR